ncbi:MAG: hypothetical protein QM533_12330 [Cytophagales bacterium]|nr:hypothetical protein [Cytophagales bacterium]
MEAPDGKQRITDCANTEGLLNPELASARARELYQAKGYPQAWIEKRLRSISVRGELTEELKARGVAEGRELFVVRKYGHTAQAQTLNSKKWRPFARLNGR